MRQFVETIPDFSFSQFETFSLKILKENPDVFAISFNDRIPEASRARYEAQMSQLSPLGSYQIMERAADKRRIPAQPRNEYVPVRYIIPLEKNTAAVGFDIYSEALRKDAIDRIYQSGSLGATAPIHLVQEQAIRPGALEIWPVQIHSTFNPQPQASINGFVIAVIKLDEMVDLATQGHIANGLQIELQDTATQEPFYRSRGFAAAEADNQYKNSISMLSEPLHMADRHWRLRIIPDQIYQQKHRVWWAWGVGIASLLFTALLQVLLLGVTGRAAVIRRKNRALKLSEERYLNMFNDNMLPMLVYHQATQRILMVNERAIQLYGWSRNELLSMQIQDLRVKTGNTSERQPAGLGETRHRLKDGRSIDVLIHQSETRFGHIDAYLEVIQDITEEKKNQAQLLLAEQVFENSGNGLVISDPDGNIISVNPAFRQLTGYTEQEAVGQNLRLLNSGRHSKDFFLNMWLALLRTGQWEGELWNRRKNGEIFPEWLSIHAIHNQQGEITHYVSSFSDITELSNARDQVEFMAFHDSLTRLPNLTLVRDRLDQSILRARRYRTKVALLCMDLDKFKYINDTHGHSIGDALLQAVAERLKQCIGRNDTLCRLSGDDFLIALYDIRELSVITNLCDQIEQALVQPFPIHQLSLRVSMSMGVSVFPDDATDTEILIKHADTAMFDAKQAGRNTYRFFDAKMNEKMARYIRITEELHSALKNQEFVLFYQPQHSLETNQVVGVEALIRWDHPQRGLRAPGEFISIAEDCGLIVPLGQWVLKEACRQAQQWREQGLFFGCMAVNLSAIQFTRGNLIEDVTRTLEDSGLPPSSLELELTESILIQDSEQVLKAVHRLQELGVKLSIDDFGTGYSSFAYLKQFNVDKLKIDRSFVHQLDQDGENQAIARAIINMAMSLNLKTIAEGIETREELLALLEMGCDEVQGYFYAKPMSAAEFKQYVSRGTPKSPFRQES